MAKRIWSWVIGVLVLVVVGSYGLWLWAVDTGEQKIIDMFSTSEGVSYETERFGYPFRVGLKIRAYTFAPEHSDMTLRVLGDMLLSSSIIDVLSGKSILTATGHNLSVLFNKTPGKQLKVDMGDLSITLDMTSDQKMNARIANLDVYEGMDDENRVLSVNTIDADVFESVRPQETLPSFDAGAKISFNEATFIDPGLSESIVINETSLEMNYDNFPSDTALEKLLIIAGEASELPGKQLQEAALDFANRMQKLGTKISIDDMKVRSPDLTMNGFLHFALDVNGVPEAHVKLTAKAEKSLVEKLNNEQLGGLKNSPAGQRLIAGHSDMDFEAKVENGMLIFGGFPLMQVPSFTELLSAMSFPETVHLRPEIQEPERQAPEDLLGALKEEEQLMQEHKELQKLQQKVEEISQTVAQ